MGIVIVCILALLLSTSSASNTTNVDIYLNKILIAEGGFQDDKEDKGNYLPDGTLVGTHRGITPVTLAAYRKVDPDSITLSDVKSVTEYEAREIYKQDYFYGPKINLLPFKLQPAVLDMYINSGSTAIKILQKEVNMPLEEQDGVIGPKTLFAIKVSNITPSDYADARIHFYITLSNKKPKLKKYLKGWVSRSNKYR